MEQKRQKKLMTKTGYAQKEWQTVRRVSSGGKKRVDGGSDFMKQVGFETGVKE